MTVRAIVFDVGGVVVKTPFELVPLIEHSVGAPAGTFPWRGPFEPEADPLWQDLQAGLITERDYWGRRAEEASPYTGGADVPSLFRRAFSGPPNEVFRPETDALQRACVDAGLLIGVLTNDMRDFNEPGWGEDAAFFARTDVVIDGSDTGVLKPDPEAYLITIRALGLRPEDVLFVDDQPFNIDGAAAVGMQTSWFDVLDPADSCRRAAAIAGVDYASLSR